MKGKTPLSVRPGGSDVQRSDALRTSRLLWTCTNTICNPTSENCDRFLKEVVKSPWVLLLTSLGWEFHPNTRTTQEEIRILHSIWDIHIGSTNSPDGSSGLTPPLSNGYASYSCLLYFSNYIPILRSVHYSVITVDLTVNFSHGSNVFTAWKKTDKQFLPHERQALTYWRLQLCNLQLPFIKLDKEEPEKSYYSFL